MSTHRSWQHMKDTSVTTVKRIGPTFIHEVVEEEQLHCKNTGDVGRGVEVDGLKFERKTSQKSPCRGTISDGAH